MIAHQCVCVSIKKAMQRAALTDAKQVIKKA